MDKLDNISVGQFYTEDYVKDSGLITSTSWNRLYSTKIRTDKDAQDPDVKNTGIDDASNVFEIVDIASTTGGGGVTDNTTEPNIPYKLGSAFENSNISQDQTGEIRVSTQIIAEQGIDTTPATIDLGDALKVEGSGGQQINRSSVTGIRYQVPYQKVDKTGTQKTFQVDAESEVIDDIRQSVFDTIMTSPITFSYTSPRNEIINKVYLRTDGAVTNFRYQVKSLVTGEVVDSYPDKFRYAKDEGVTLTGSGIQQIDLFYTGNSAPNRYLDGDTYEITIKWDGGNFLGNSSNVPYFSYDYQKFEFVNMISEKDSVTNLSDVTDAGSGEIITDDERTKLESLPYPNYGAGYFEPKESTYITTAGTWEKVDAAFNILFEKNIEYDNINKRWEYTGIEDTAISIFASFTGSHDDDSTREVSWEFRKNGLQLVVPVKKAIIERYDSMSITMLVPYVEMSTNDYIELYATINNDTENVETANMNLLIR